MPVLKVRDPNTGTYVSLLGSSASDHGTMSGLEDDDHPQYLTQARADALYSAVPVGTIVMYGSATAPTGWHLCNGTAHGSSALQAVLGGPNTPDLRDRFVVGAGSSYAQNATGGATTVALTPGQLPLHSGDMTFHGAAGGTPMQAVSGVFTSAMNAPKYLGGTLGAAASVGIVHLQFGNNEAHENRPPYYALTYIIKK